MNASLIQTLRSKDMRSKRQSMLLKEFQSPVVTVKLNIPGPTKTVKHHENIIMDCVMTLEKAVLTYDFKIKHRELQNFNSGPEYLMVIEGPERHLKTIAMEIEDNHWLGRLFDIDIIAINGEAVSRTLFGKNFRRCMICDDVAFVCARSRKHDLEILTNVINEMIVSYYA